MATRTLELWTDSAVKFVEVGVPAGEEIPLVEAAIEQQGDAKTVEIAKLLLEQAGREPDRLFLPTVWVEEEVKASLPVVAEAPPVTLDEDDDGDQEEEG